MAIVKGVKERVHLPLYDSLFVRPTRQLRDFATSSVLKFFVDIQGKTKLETNMQQSSLLPHWNTFEARALRVVISDLPAIAPRDFENRHKEPNVNGNDSNISVCVQDVDRLFDDYRLEISSKQVNKARESLDCFNAAAYSARAIPDDIETCLGLLRRYCDRSGVGPILEMQRALRSIRKELATLIRSRSRTRKTDEIEQFAKALDELKAKGEEYDLLNRMDQAKDCLDGLCQLSEFVRQIKERDFKEIGDCVKAAEDFIDKTPSKIEHINHLKRCLGDAFAEINRLKTQGREARAEARNARVGDALGYRLMSSKDGCLFACNAHLLAQLIYNSVTTLFVGEKVMIQMPTWFFPAGAGPYSEDGRVVTHGFPTPQATFNFAEPVLIDTQQNFRVEIEFPEVDAVEELESLYGPFFIWVVLDGYMTRDVQ
jgi:hypothetical protein